MFRTKPKPKSGLQLTQHEQSLLKHHDLLCATGGLCEGVCREKHLDQCKAAYNGE